MTKHNVSIDPALLADLLSSQNGMAQLVEGVLNEILQTQMSQHLNADRYEHSDERIGVRNGNRIRKIHTRIGTLTLQIPQTRDGSFCSDIFKRYQRNEQALVLAMMEMYVQGVSTRKVSAITEELCGTSFSKSLVSSLCINLDARVRAFTHRRLEGEYPVLMVDAMYIKARHNDRVASRAALIVSAIRSDGYREIVGLEIDNGENLFTWKEAFARLKSRGLKGVQLVVSDAHDGIIESVKQQFTGASWQRCQVHLMRNIAAYAPTKLKTAVMDAVRLVFNASDMTEARRQLKEFGDTFAKTAPKSVVCLDEAFDDAMSVMALPVRSRKRLRSTNMQERLNQEVRRRERVIRIFPNDEAAFRLIGAVLADINEAWMERVYLDMTELYEARSSEDFLKIKKASA